MENIHTSVPIAMASLVHGNNSSLLRKYNCTKTLKHPRSDSTRATKVGVTHKFCSVDHVKNALHVKIVKAKVQKDKAERLDAKLQKMLSDSWHQSNTPIPFLKSLHLLRI